MLEDPSVLAMSDCPDLVDSDESSQPSRSTSSAAKIRTKKWAPKTFNGCTTCKKRRIKCDEGKPACQRCTKSNIKCGGYAPPKIRLFDPTSSSSSSSSTHAITARPTITAQPLSARTRPPAEPEPEHVAFEDSQLHTQLSSFASLQGFTISSRFGTQEEYQTFQFFLEKTSGLISQYSQPYLWSVLLPQATWQHASIKHSIIALALLHQSLTAIDPISQRANHNFMFHYNSAIRALVADKPSVEIVLAASVIFWTLENFSGSGQAAFEHMKAAIQILGEWKTKRQPHDSANDLISRYLEPTIIEGIKFSSKSRVEELVGDMGALSLSPRDRRVMNIQYPSFDNLEDAEKYLSACIDKLLTLKIRTHQHSNADRAAMIDEIETLDAELYKWMHLFQNLTATGPVYVRRMLIVHNVAANIILDSLKEQAQYSHEPELQKNEDEQLPPGLANRCRKAFVVLEVEEMLGGDNLATQEMQDSSSPRLGFLAPLFLVATSARALDIRRRAITALRSTHIEEGPWTSRHAANLAETMLDIANECAVSHETVDLQDLSIDFDEEEEVLWVQWEAQNVAAIPQASTIKTVDVCGINWHPLETPELIRRYGYQCSSAIEAL